MKRIVASFTSAARVTALLTVAMLPSVGAASAIDEYRDVVARGRHAVVADIDNDSMLLKRDDGFYTSGLRMRSTWTVAEGGQARTWGWHVGQELYTASDINLPPARIGRNDHPYAGWLYAGVAREVSESSGGFRRFGLDVGCLGPCAGGEFTQRTLHSLLNQPQAQAWSTQLRNEFGVVLHGAWAPLRWVPVRSFDLQPSVHGRFGNIFTDAGVQVMMRAGQLNLFPHQPALYGFLRADARAVGYNATMQGGYFSGANARTVAPRRAVGELEIGVAWQGQRFGLSASVVRRGNEVADLPNSQGSQNFARVQLVYLP
ncbi:lipid A deacylase LpxR family protein [Lacisediminimonas profundi]|uniref:lipid A deacylase LpxR family protein n=1 Tax=Lacisediminimonas profundi TaxID=2603856 RepID=UPI00124B8A72|nr:lipid A deacylase LpxR family protein [Lacisediminimonas profundi]